MTKLEDVPIKERWPSLSKTVIPLLIAGIGFLFYLGVAGLTGLPSPIQPQTETYQEYLQHQQASQGVYPVISLVLLFAASYCTFILLRTRHKRRTKREVKAEE